MSDVVVVLLCGGRVKDGGNVFSIAARLGGIETRLSRRATMGN